MKTKPHTPKTRCPVCGRGRLRATSVNHEEKRNGRLYLFTHVPAKVCAACGEVWIDEPTLREIDRLIRTGKPTRKVETPVYDLAVGASSR